MKNLLNKVPWQQLLLVTFTALVSYFLIPVITSRYNDIRSLRDARLARAIRFGDRNNDFNSKINATATLLRMYDNHNYRTKISGAELNEARKDLYTKYKERYLDLDATAWWWPSEFVREADALKLLSPDEFKQLQADVADYNKSVLATVNQVTYLWQFLDSPEYKVDEQSRDKIARLEVAMDKEFQTQHAIREDLVKKIAILFAESNFRTQKTDLLGF